MRYLVGYLNETVFLLEAGKNIISGGYVFALLVLPALVFIGWGISSRNYPVFKVVVRQYKMDGRLLILILSVALYFAAHFLAFSPDNILSSNTVYRVFANEIRIYYQERYFASKQLRYPERSYFQKQGYQFYSRQYPAVKTPAKEKLTPRIKPNLVLIILESVAAKDTGLQKHISTKGTDVTPFLNSLIPRSVVFSPFFSNADYTAGAETAIFCSVHDSLRYSIPHGSILRDLTNTKLFCLPEILRGVGYSTSFFHSYTATFDNKHIFFPLNGVQEVIDRDHPVFKGLKRVSFGLISDEKVFLYGVKFLNQTRKPFFSSFLTVNNHTPFVMNDRSKKKTFSKKKRYNDYLNTVKQTDDALRKFFEAAEKQDWYNNTIFIITSDNGILLANEDIKEMRWEYFFKMWHQVPFLIHSPSQRFGLKPRLVHLRSASHVDVTPTILDILGMKLTNPFAGESLFDQNRRDYTLIYDWFNNYYRLSWPYVYHNTDHQMHDLIREKKIHSEKLDEYRGWVVKSRDFFNHLTRADRIWPVRLKIDEQPAK